MRVGDLRVGSLFSGIGGLDLGLERAGMEIVWQCESDPYCRSVLRKHWPHIEIFDDVRTLHAPRGVDLICGGFPCQPVSQAGAKLAQADERWLWPEFARLVRVLRPRFVLVENVTGLLARGMGDVLRDLAEVGFDAEWECVPAGAFGAPHMRERVFIVAYAQGERRELRTPAGQRSRGPASGSDATLADSNGGRRPQRFPEERNRVFTRSGSYPERDPSWAIEPDVGRLVDGLSPRLARARLTALGNAVVPQVAEWIGRRLMTAHRAVSTDPDQRVQNA